MSRKLRLLELVDNHRVERAPPSARNPRPGDPQPCAPLARACALAVASLSGGAARKGCTAISVVQKAVNMVATALHNPGGSRCHAG